MACALGCFAFVGADDAPKSKQKAQENPAKEVFHEYLRNEVAAERKFLKKRLKAAGFIKEISEKDGKIVVLLKTDDYPFGVLYEGFSCVFDDDKGIDALSVRGKATIDGEVAGHTKMKTPLATNSVDAHPEYQQIVTLVHCRIVAEIDARSDISKAEKEKNGPRDLKAKKIVKKPAAEPEADPEEEAKARKALIQALQLAERGFEKESQKRYREILKKYPKTEAANKAKKLVKEED